MEIESYLFDLLWTIKVKYLGLSAPFESIGNNLCDLFSDKEMPIGIGMNSVLVMLLDFIANQIESRAHT